ncbi:conjugal transfer protein [Conexibacter sp. CPCC 206217]|uniref:conjugal transfer protein n=1 Tax=Conexibacter sp. CPCC 206217 TaxID=3064574 RepID=UPI00271B68A4|nr:conjugal transfer protein [Conexibacter sp. CPCC 206217]MDO8213913.1 conjugal transfer protein [Conexibacter sp. CPCC 206217]
MLARGIGDILADPQPAAPQTAIRASQPQFPDGEARAFAAAFARSYVAVAPRERERQVARLSRFAARSLSDQAAPVVSPRSPGAEVVDATVAREVSLGESRALITVAVLLRDGRSRYLTVPVARDDAGGLVVYDLPAFSAPPVLGAAAAPEAIPLAGPDGVAVGDLVERFLRAYLQSTEAPGLAYFLAPGVHVASIGAGLSLESVEEVGRLGGGPARGMQLAVTARVRDLPSRATYRQRFRITVQRRDRWYVTGVAGGPRS